MMLKILLRSITTGLIAVSLLQLSCDKSPSTPVADNSGGFGSAVVKLPDLSSGALSKSTAVITSNSLTLLIVASDMDTMKYSWPVSTLKGQTVKIDGIPSGDNRCFEGFLTNKSGVLTNSGKVTVRIITGQDVPVYLKLSGVGGADVCIEIEGYPSSCNTNDSIYINTCLSGKNRGLDTIGSILTGTIQLSVIGGKSSGQFTLISSNDKNAYIFYRPVTIHDSVIQTVVTNSSNKKNQAVYMVTNNHSGLNFAFLYADSTIYSPIVAEVFGVQCYDTSSSINVNSCLTVSTQNGGPTTGNIQFQAYAGKTSGQLTFVTSGVKNSYIFMMPVLITTSGNTKRCLTQVLNVANKKYQYLEMGITYSQVSYGYLYADSVVSSSVFAKFFSAPCKDTIPVDTIRDTTVMNLNFVGTGINPDTSKFTSNLLIKVAGNNAIGTLITSNFSQIPDTLPVGGTANRDQNGYGSFILYSITPDSKSRYMIVIKFAPGIFDGYISRTDNGVQKTIAHLTNSAIAK